MTEGGKLASVNRHLAVLGRLERGRMCALRKVQREHCME